ncbi:MULTISPECIES: Crp/Fnr family transcriptional regulator [unclassified Micromonospora]|uniref:Crp/Fnr family transcriptional regulator n=1 Tax=unclassified Micromonospora TaxID=2617518 RepID=UPI0003EEB6CB|nr:MULTISPECIES: Crp/Fnr family transcriptional regulator [unclassified Micromonospora]EWM68061.1 transcriptional regulator [Micromonospora sp. M42]MCK1808975.1 Crp/Fnr family transcriptional regulator [Micromonospora sp. R42106]MCK1833532.1 Crp/Fnr family transcriptional regulator [Micromonospora sp. R42003]MCK1845506.1 Crp/Fnr family transcriptional regulator [Micromonospora sp. R42004]MCM1015924.1 Crp/Fnr family transcriptional regulator [Micromonospora sp. XM-20-01]
MDLGHHHRVPFWHALAEEQRAGLRALGSLCRYPPEAVLVHERDDSDFVIVLLEGCVKVSANTQRGYQAVLALRDGGDLVGELAGFDGGGRSATLTAMTPVEALVIPADRFRVFLKGFPQAAEIVQRTVSVRLREADRQRAAAGAESVPQRLAELLLDLGRRYGVPDDNGGLLVELPLSQADLAGLVLSSQRTVGRTLEHWRDEGWVVTGRRSVLITAAGRAALAAAPHGQMSR